MPKIPVIVLAGGAGERIKDISDTKPKVLLKVAGKPIVEYANPIELEEKVFEYNQIIIELNIDAIAEIEKNIIVIYFSLLLLSFPSFSTLPRVKGIK